MIRILFVLTMSLWLGACASQPEIPQEFQEIQVNKKVQKTSPSKKYQRLLAQTGLRSLETDCQVYSQPNLYSERINTAKAGGDVWTQDTGSSWYKVYKNKKYGYMSKICFTQ